MAGFSSFHVSPPLAVTSIISKVDFPIASEEGGKEALHAVLGNFHMGSDFQVFAEGSFSIPAIYLHDWPDRYIHTNYDTPANIDPTKLKRSAFIGAASAYVIADFNSNDVTNLIDLQKRQVLKRSVELMNYFELLPTDEQENAKYHFWDYEIKAFNSINSSSVRYFLLLTMISKNMAMCACGPPNAVKAKTRTSLRKI